MPDEGCAEKTVALSAGVRAHLCETAGGSRAADVQGHPGVPAGDAGYNSALCGAAGCRRFGEYQKDVFQMAHKEVLLTSQQMNNCDEVVLVYNIHTEERTKALGDTNHVDSESSIDFKTLQKHFYARELVMIYNHPSTANFSFADLDYFIANDYIGTMSIVTNQGEIYTLRKTSRYNYGKIRDIELRLVNKYSLGEQKLIVEEFLRECRKGGVDYVKRK